MECLKHNKPGALLPLKPASQILHSPVIFSCPSSSPLSDSPPPVHYPSPGTIDMDLITTGVSASERGRRLQIQAAVLSLLQDKAAAGRGTIKAAQVGALQGGA